MLASFSVTMNVSFSVTGFDVGMWVDVHGPTSFVCNIFMLCAMLLIARLLTGGVGGSQNSHTYVWLSGGWVFRPPTYMHICCGAARRGIPLEVRSLFPDLSQPPAGMCGECHLCQRPNCGTCDRCQSGLRCTFGLCYFMDPMRPAEDSGYVFHHSVKFGYCGVCEICTQAPCLVCGGCRWNTLNPNATPPLMCSNRACIITGLPYGEDVSRFFHPYRGHPQPGRDILLLLPPNRILSELERLVVDVAGNGAWIPDLGLIFWEPAWAPNGINPWISHRLPFVDRRLQMVVVGQPILPAIPDPFMYRDNPLAAYPSPPPSPPSR